MAGEIVNLKQLPATVEHVIHRELTPDASPGELALADEAVQLARDVLAEVRREIFHPVSYTNRMALLKIVLSSSLKKTNTATSDDFEELRLTWERTAEEMQRVPHTGNAELDVLTIGDEDVA